MKDEIKALVDEAHAKGLSKEQIINLVIADDNLTVTPQDVLDIQKAIDEKNGPVTTPVAPAEQTVVAPANNTPWIVVAAAAVIMFALFMLLPSKEAEAKSDTSAVTQQQSEILRLQTELEKEKAAAAQAEIDKNNQAAALKAAADAAAAQAASAPVVTPTPVVASNSPKKEVVIDLDFWGAESSAISTNKEGHLVMRERSTRHIDEIFEEGRAQPSPTLNPKYQMLIWKRGDIEGRSIIGDPVNLNTVAMAGRTEVSSGVLDQLRKKSGVADLEVHLLSVDEFVSRGLAKGHKFTNTEGKKWVTLYSPSGNFVASNN